MEFEFDPTKSAANQDKHGIEFVVAQALWLDDARLEIPARTEDELRWLLIGRIDALCWSAVITHGEGRVRTISMRRSRGEEVELYEGEAAR